MPRLAILNMCVGFLTLTLAASAGTFIATELTTGYLKDRTILDDWSTVIMSSAHGHTNMMGLVLIGFGLTLPYSTLTERIKKLQTVGFLLGVVAFGPLMYARAVLGPKEGIDPTEVGIGFCLSMTLVAMASHCFGLYSKYRAHT